MELPSMFTGESLKRLLQGAAVGIVATIVVGFNWGGWTLGSTAREMAQKSSSTATVAALAPICVDQFQHAPDAATNLVELKKISSWEQSAFIQKGGWSAMPGGKASDSAVAQACATLLSSLN
jgi:hypothetical protein